MPLPPLLGPRVQYVLHHQGYRFKPYPSHRPMGAGEVAVHEKLTVGRLATVLGEREYQVLARVLRVLGPERCVELLVEALTIENQGGRLTRDGRRRTLGGIFLQLCRE